jgi:hypothetical protein
MPADKNKRDYEIGRGRPPKHTRLKPGQCGNPRGRPKKDKKEKSLAVAIAEALQMRFRLRENGRERVATGVEAVALRLVADAVQGKASAQKMIFAWASRFGHPVGSAASATEAEHAKTRLREELHRMAERMRQVPKSSKE